MELYRVIEKLGFSEEESKVYIALLQLGHGTLNAIARKVKLSKDKAYNILKHLLEKNFVDTYSTRGVFYFTAMNPQQLIDTFEIRLQKAKMVLPELLALDNVNTVKPRITYYEGKNGLISIMEDSLTSQGDILCWADISVAYATLGDYYPTYIRKKNVLNLFVRGIFTDDPKSVEFKQKGGEEAREVRMIPREKFPFKNEINIYNDSVSIIAHRELLGVIIQSKDIAETQRSIFKLGWEYAGMLEAERAKDIP